MYSAFKTKVLGRIIGDGQCVSLVVNNSNAYVEALFPGVSWPVIIPPVASAKQMAGNGNQYLQWIANDHTNVNQLPKQGDIMVFGATPAIGYSNTYRNPDGHTGICDDANSSGYNLLQQNAPAFGQAVNVTHYAWRFRPCLGWYHPRVQTAVQQTVTPKTAKLITLPASTGPWHLYKPGGPYNYLNSRNVKGLLVPSAFGGLTYRIDKDLGNGIYRITTEDFGQGDIWTQGSSVIIK